MFRRAVAFLVPVSLAYGHGKSERPFRDVSEAGCPRLRPIAVPAAKPVRGRSVLVRRSRQAARRYLPPGTRVLTGIPSGRQPNRPISW